jgi:phosphoribosylaminoimidazole-succinocarboxamide synthase
MPNRTGILAEGKSKRLHTTEDPNLLIQEFKDDATAFNGVKKASIKSKGVFNCDISTRIFHLLQEAGIATHLVENLSDTEQLVKRVDIVMIEFIVRNRVAGSLAKRYGMAEGPELPRPIIEYFVKDDELGDPLIGRDCAEALGYADFATIDECTELTLRINQLMLAFWKQLGVNLVDFKIEFGRDAEGNLLLADEITPDGCRLWDAKTNEKLDKDVFRRDLGDLSETYARVAKMVADAIQL